MLSVCYLKKVSCRVHRRSKSFAWNQGSQEREPVSWRDTSCWQRVMQLAPDWLQLTISTGRAVAALLRFPSTIHEHEALGSYPDMLGFKPFSYFHFHFFITFKIYLLSLAHAVFRCVRKIPIRVYSRRNVCLSVRMEQLGSHWTYFHEIWYLSIFRKSTEKIYVSLKFDENNECFT